LGPAAVLAAGLHAGLAELLDQVGDGLLFARRCRRPTLECIRGQYLHVAQQRFAAGAVRGKLSCDGCRGEQASQQAGPRQYVHGIPPGKARIHEGLDFAMRSSHTPRPCALIAMSPPRTSATICGAAPTPWRSACSTYSAVSASTSRAWRSGASAIAWASDAMASTGPTRSAPIRAHSVSVP